MKSSLKAYETLEAIAAKDRAFMRAQNIVSSLSLVLFLIFLTLKLAEVGQVARWSWWYVTAPLYVPTLIALVVVALFTLWAAVGGNK